MPQKLNINQVHNYFQRKPLITQVETHVGLRVFDEKECQGAKEPFFSVKSQDFLTDVCMKQIETKFLGIQQLE